MVSLIKLAGHTLLTPSIKLRKLSTQFEMKALFFLVSYALISKDISAKQQNSNHHQFVGLNFESTIDP